MSFSFSIMECNVSKELLVLKALKWSKLDIYLTGRNRVSPAQGSDKGTWGAALESGPTEDPLNFTACFIMF